MYVTTKAGTRLHQITFEDIVFGDPEKYTGVTNVTSGGNTITVKTDNLYKYRRLANTQGLIQILRFFNDKYRDLFSKERSTLYKVFFIPKKSGGYRKISAPVDELSVALYELKAIFENDFGVLYHTSAFAYVKDRCTVDSIKRHQMNDSKWFLKTDFSDFFGSTTIEFVMDMLSNIYPFKFVIDNILGKAELRNALSLCFLDGGLPQGTPISPLITNLMMIPFDHEIFNELRKKHFVYTRYADDILISSKYTFNKDEIVLMINGALRKYSAPFRIKDEKTRYGSSSGSNWNLGVMLNKDNKITVGRKKKERLKAACFSYITDKKSNADWDKSDIYVLIGQISYFRMVEPEYMKSFIKYFNEKHKVNLMAMLRKDVSA